MLGCHTTQRLASYNQTPISQYRIGTLSKLLTKFPNATIRSQGIRVKIFIALDHILFSYSPSAGTIRPSWNSVAQPPATTVKMQVKYRLSQRKLKQMGRKLVINMIITRIILLEMRPQSHDDDSRKWGMAMAKGNTGLCM